jgi:hypothetical protein
MGAISILGGTGPEGLGLAFRLAQIGEEVVIGSREVARAEAAAERVAAAVSGARVRGAENPVAAAQGEMVVLAFPHAAVEPYLAVHAAAFAGKVVLDVMVPLRFAHGVCLHVAVPDGSLGAMIQRLAPAARVVSAFKNIAAEDLQQVDRPLEADVLVCGDDAAAKDAVARLARRIPRVRAIDAGPLSSAVALEHITVLLLNINRRYSALTSVRISGLPPAAV